MNVFLPRFSLFQIKLNYIKNKAQYLFQMRGKILGFVKSLFWTGDRSVSRHQCSPCGGPRDLAAIA